MLHDAGMTIASFENGLSDLQKTVEWKDAYAASLRKLSQSLGKTVVSLPTEYVSSVDFAALRLLHARNAEKLLDLEWRNLNGGKGQRLLEDEGLHSAYAGSIGRIAHSHNWNVDRVAESLNGGVGAEVALPPSWILDEVKVACLLRCADAAHIDSRRAPSFDFALVKPTQHSAEHWTFQSRLNSPAVKDEEIIYTGGSDFPATEANAWWLCYDALEVLEREIVASNAILKEKGCSQFYVKRVHGAGNIRLLAKRIRPSGWKPVDAEVRVSAPAELAKTLGGRNLYGNGAVAPIRELLQNAVDAVRARRTMEGDQNLGIVRLTLDKDSTGAGWLHVEDDGIGMSERVLTGSLLDFGKSFWNSNLLQEEFPGLQGKGLAPIGKFGIGFFSTFLLGDRVRVLSRRYDAGRAETKALEFRSLDARPLVRDAEPGEYAANFSTRVSVQLKGGLSDTLYNLSMHSRGPRAISSDLSTIILHRIRQIIAPLDVRVEFRDESTGACFDHKPEWKNAPPSDFLRELLSSTPSEEMEGIVSAHYDLVRSIEDDSGRLYGRAALDMTLSAYAPQYCFVSVGGFCVSSFGPGPDSNRFPVVGVLSGDTDDISRETAEQNIPDAVLAGWATEQARLIDQSLFSKNSLLTSSNRVLSMNGDPGSLPYCFFAGNFICYDEFKERAASLQSLVVPAHRRYDDNFDLKGISGAAAALFFENIKRNVAIFNIEDTDAVLDKARAAEHSGLNRVDCIEAELRQSVYKAGTSMKHAMETLEKIWGKRPRFFLAPVQMLSVQHMLNSKLRWALHVERAG